MGVNPLEHFLSHINILDNGCWEWTASKDSNGYGWFYANGKTGRAHRFSYEVLVGTIPIGLEIDHLCRNTSCVNPDHLEAVTRQENTKRGLAGKVNGDIQRAKTHCPKGHPYDELNTYHRPDGGRDCKMCLRTRSIESLLRRRIKS